MLFERPKGKIQPTVVVFYILFILQKLTKAALQAH